MATIDLKYAVCVENKRRSGWRRWYFRVRNPRINIPLRGEPGTADFMDDYSAARAALESHGRAKPTGEELTAPGTVKALVISYYASNGEWKDKFAPDTRDTRKRIIDKFVEKYGTTAVRAFTPPMILKIIDKRCKTPSTRRNWVTTIKHLFGHAVPTMRKDNPFNAIDRAKVAAMPKGNDGHHSWTEAQVSTYRGFWPLGTKERLTMEFAYEAVSRRGEVVNLGPQHLYTGKKGERRICIKRTHGSEDVDFEISDMLAAAIDAMPRREPVNGVMPLTFLATSTGKARSKKALGSDFARWCRAVGLPDECRMHGLKKSGMSRDAEDGQTDHELQAKSGHKTAAMVHHYTKAARKKKLADSGAAKSKAARAAEKAEAANQAGPSLRIVKGDGAA